MPPQTPSENNNNQAAPQVVQPTVTPTGPTPANPTTPTPMQAAESPQALNASGPANTGKSKMMMILGMLVVLLLVGAGAAFYFLNIMPKTQTKTTTTQDQTSSDVTDLEKDLDEVNVASVEGEFTETDQDLDSL